MDETMKTVTLHATWEPREGFKLGMKDIDGKLTYLGSKVWRQPHVELEEKTIPNVKGDEVLIEVEACGICGSDVHMAQADEDGYIYYPEYISMFCDNDWQETARLRGKVIDGMRLTFKHNHYSVGGLPLDATYRKEESQEAWNHGQALFRKRQKENFGVKK